ncbi:RER1-like protein, partial [Mya arenaria]
MYSYEEQCIDTVVYFKNLPDMLMTAPYLLNQDPDPSCAWQCRGARALPVSAASSALQSKGQLGPEIWGNHISLRLSQLQQNALDQATPHVGFRWIITALLFITYFIRGWYIITYALGIYLLNLFIGFLTPKIDPNLSMESDDDGPELPTKSSDEFKPFMRRIWLNTGTFHGPKARPATRGKKTQGKCMPSSRGDSCCSNAPGRPEAGGRGKRPRSGDVSTSTACTVSGAPEDAPSHLAAGLLTATEPIVAFGAGESAAGDKRRRKCTLLATSAPEKVHPAGDERAGE